MKKCKKILILLMFMIFTLLNHNLIFAADFQQNLTAKSAFLMDNKTNKVLYEKDSKTKRFPASTTKILTAILALENCQLDDVVTAKYDAIIDIPEGYSSANIQIGEELTIEQLVKLLLVHSANDAANVLAEHVGGSLDSFATMMNTKLNELGLTGSHFTNAYGKHDENHYTTAYDLAKLLQYCIKNEDFRRISGSASCAIPATNKSGPRLYTSTNELLISTNSNYYPYLTAGKTGFTSQAMDCLVSSSYKDNLELICVVLGCDDSADQRFKETKSLMEYAYQNYSVKEIVKQNDILTNIEVKGATKDTKNLDLLADKSISALVSNSENDNFEPEIILNDNIHAPLDDGAIIGKAKYNIDGIEYSTNLITSHSVEKSMLITYTLYAVLAIFILFIGYLFLFKSKKKKYRKKRKHI